jgi:hypothetical protein
MANEIVTDAIMLDLLTAAYVQFMTMLTELWKVLSQALKGLCSKTTTIRMNGKKNNGRESLTFLLY